VRGRFASGLLCAALAALALLLAPAVAGQEASRDELVDPYTKFEPEAWAAAGYEKSRRFGFGDGHGTQDVEDLLGEVQLLWVETEHFRIGSSLPEHKLENEERKAMKEELGRLKERLPKLKTNTRVLDRWLRLHLYAMRLEDAYADFLGRMGLTDSDFPDAEGRVPEGQPVRGAGPYLGMKEKFTVLLLEKKSSLARYNGRWGQGGPPSPQRFNFHRRGTMGMATCWEFFEGEWKRDAALHGHVVWNVVQLFVSSFKGYTHMVPPWFADGMASWYQRRIDPHFPTYSNLAGGNKLAAKEWNWPPKVRARVKADYYPSLDEMMGWRQADPRDYSDAMMAWSKVDWLLSHDDGAFATFMERLHDPIPVETARAITEAESEVRCREALELAWGKDPAALDAAWSDWVMKAYPKK
jgi:hypothetical protein